VLAWPWAACSWPLNLHGQALWSLSAHYLRFDTSWSLTYMSIQDEINAHLSSERLVRLAQSFPGLAERRKVYTIPEISSLLRGPWSDTTWERRWSRAVQQIDEFIDGLYSDPRITVRSAPRKKSTCFMSRLDPDSAEVWEIRCRDPKPGLRIFGSFVTKDEFVALMALPHECLNNDDDWNALIAQYKGEWDRHFTTQPFSGAYPHEYISNAVILD
jgi:hypothetical protein